jgi:hypothetical protein
VNHTVPWQDMLAGILGTDPKIVSTCMLRNTVYWSYNTDDSSRYTGSSVSYDARVLNMRTDTWNSFFNVVQYWIHWACEQG